VDYSERITVEPNKMVGKPRVRGLRITVCDVKLLLDENLRGHSQISWPTFFRNAPESES